MSRRWPIDKRLGRWVLFFFARHNHHVSALSPTDIVFFTSSLLIHDPKNINSHPDSRAEGESRESKALPIYIWIKVLLYLEYSELKHVRSVSKFLFDCCNDRRIQESLFTAPLNQETLELHHQAGDEVELHPALSAYKREINIYEHSEDDYEGFVDWLNDYDKIGRTPFENLKDLGKENVSNPPISRIKVLDKEWDSDSIRKKIRDWVQRPIDSHTGRFLDELEGSEGENEGSDEEKESWEEDEVDQGKEEELLELSREGPRAITVSEII